MKISVIGYSGCGKSTLAKKLSEIYNLPLLYLDTVHFLPDWVERSENESLEMVSKFLENKDWVIDGNYKKWFHKRRIEESDLIVFMNFSRMKSLWGAFKRYVKYKNKNRESMAEGCNEKLDFEFVSWLLWHGRKKERQQRFDNICKKYSSKIIVCKSYKDSDNLLKKAQSDCSISLKL